jgi:hypothetical protein
MGKGTAISGLMLSEYEGNARKLLKAVEEFYPSITNNAGFIPNYSERYRHGERLSTGCVASTVPQMVSKRMANGRRLSAIIRQYDTRPPSPVS